MTFPARIYLTFSTVLLVITAIGQYKPISKLEKVTVADFNPISPVVDSNANAVVLADIGSTEFEGNNSGNFYMIFKYTKRMLLKNKNAFDDATIKVRVYVGGNAANEEKFEDLEASTYTLENGTIIETKLDKNAVFKEKYNRSTTIRKFTFPNIKEGCIIEYKYTIKSPFYTFGDKLRSWYFQGKYPVLWSQYHVVIPPMFSYYPVKQGFLPYTIDSAKAIYKSYVVIIPGGTAYSSTGVQNFSGDALYKVWAIKDVPVFKKESYTSSSSNYISKIDFQLYSIKWSDNSDVQHILKGWEETAENILKDEDYKSVLEDKNTWLDEDLHKLTKDTSDVAKAHKIYSYVKDNFTCTDHDASIWLTAPIKKVYQAKRGSVTDINLLLIAMLNRFGFDAKPVMLSTKDNGRVTESTAILSQYNYVIARLKIDTTYYLLDASEPRLGFGKLTENCYNNSGRLIAKMPILIPLQTDQLLEEKNTNLFIVNDEKEGFSGAFTTKLGYFESTDLREKLLDKKPEDYLKELAKNYSSDVELKNIEIDSLKQYDEPVTVSYEMVFNLNDEDVIYFNPLFNEATKQNPFTSAERLYPVEMPYKINEVINLNMEIPRGYKVDEIPKSTRVKLNDNEGMFEYIIVNSGGRIQLRSKIVLEKATFEPDDYETLRNFFGFIVKKQAEQIVFKKIK